MSFLRQHNQNGENNRDKYIAILVKGIAIGIVIFSMVISFSIAVKYFNLSVFVIKPTETPTETPTVIVSGETPVIILETPREEYIKGLSDVTTLDEKIIYVLTNGKKGEDYVSVSQEKQNTNLGRTREENNIILTGYIRKYLYPFPISNNRNGYLVITTNRPVASARDMLLGINGKNMGTIIKGRDLSTKNDNRYVFDMKQIPMADVTLNGSINLLHYAIGGKVNLSSVVGEKGNSVDEVALVFLP